MTRFLVRIGISIVIGWMIGVQAAFTFGRLYLLPVKKQELPQTIRMEPVW